MSVGDPPRQQGPEVLGTSRPARALVCIRSRGLVAKLVHFGAVLGDALIHIYTTRHVCGRLCNMYMCVYETDSYTYIYIYVYIHIYMRTYTYIQI